MEEGWDTEEGDTMTTQAWAIKVAGMTVAGLVFMGPVGTGSEAAANRDGSGPVSSQTSQQTDRGNESIQGNRTVIGIVRKLSGDQIEVNTGDVHPRYLPLIQAREKGFQDIKVGDKLRIVLNDQNLLVDYHPLDERSHHRLLQGRITEPLVVGHDEAVIRLDTGEEKMFPVRSMVRSKVASIPVGTEVLVLLDETNQIADVTFDKEAIAAQKGTASIKSPLKGAHERIAGTIVGRLQADRIKIRTDGGREEGYEVRPAVQPKLAQLGEGQTVILLVDDERKVVDVAVPPQGEGRG